MDIFVPGLRDRRMAAADENRTANNREIYGRGTSARRLSQRSSGGNFDVGQARNSRSANIINTIVLHQTTFYSRDDLPSESEDNDISDDHRLDKVIAHFIVRADGTIIYTHDVEHILNSVSRRWGIDIEFEGKYGHEHIPQSNRLRQTAIRSGHRLIFWLKGYLPNIQYIHPHGQIQRSGGKRDSCSGPDIWINVGEWAVTNLNLTCDQTFARYPNRGISDAQRNSAYYQDIADWW